MNIAENIKKIRLNNQLTQQEFADKVGISRHSLLNYEKGKRIPPMDVAIRISKAFNVALDMLNGSDMNSSSMKKDNYDLLKESGLVSHDFELQEVSYNLEKFKSLLTSADYPVDKLNDEEVIELFKKTMHFWDFEFFMKGYIKVYNK